MNLRSGLVLFLLLVMFDGAVRKWVLPEFEQLIYIVKDVLLLGLLAACLMRQGARLPPGLSGTAFAGLLTTYGAIAALQMLNPSLPSFALGLLGLKSHILYAALVVIVPAAFRDAEEIARTLRYLAVPGVLVLALGIAQFYFPIDHPINRYVRGTTQDVATFGMLNKVRITSTFSYVSGMTTFVFFAICLGLALLAAGHWRLRENKIATACLVAAIAVTPMTGARWIYYMAIVCTPLFLYAMIRSGMLQTRYVWRLIGISFLTVSAISTWSMEALESFEYRRQSTSDAPRRIEGILLEPFRFGGEAGLLGYGAGATHQAAPALVRDASPYSWLPSREFENEPSRVMLELGIIGFIAAFALRVYLCRLAWVVLVNGRTRSEKALAAAALIFFVAHLVSPIVYNVTGGALYWLFAGIIATVLRDQHLQRYAVDVAPQTSLPARAVRAPR